MDGKIAICSLLKNAAPVSFFRRLTSHDLDKTDPTSLAVGPFPRAYSRRIDVRLPSLEPHSDRLSPADSQRSYCVSRDAKLRLA